MAKRCKCGKIIKNSKYSSCYECYCKDRLLHGKQIQRFCKYCGERFWTNKINYLYCFDCNNKRNASYYKYLQVETQKKEIEKQLKELQKEIKTEEEKKKKKSSYTLCSKCGKGRAAIARDGLCKKCYQEAEETKAEFEKSLRSYPVMNISSDMRRIELPRVQQSIIDLVDCN